MASRQGEISPSNPTYVQAMVTFNISEIEEALKRNCAIQAWFFPPALRSIMDAGLRPRLKEIGDTPAPTLDEANAYIQKLGATRHPLRSEDEIGPLVLSLSRLSGGDGRNIANMMIEAGKTEPRETLSNVISIPVPDFIARVMVEQSVAGVGGTISSPLKEALEAIGIPEDLASDLRRLEEVSNAENQDLPDDSGSSGGDAT